jgi:MATE family multidrug resistance protein
MSSATHLKVENSYRNIISLALPISISILIPQISILTNTLFLGNYKPTVNNLTTQDLLSASGIAGIYYLTLVMIGYGMVSGMLMLMSRKAGENDNLGVGKIFSNGIIMCLLLSTVLVGTSFFLAPTIFSFSIHDVNIQNACLKFINIRIWGLPFIMLCQLSNSLFLATSNSSRIIIGSIVQTIVNVCLDYFLIFGVGFFPEMGLEGTALASCFSEVFYAFTVFLIIRFQASFKFFEIHLTKHFSWIIIKETFLKASPIMVQYFLSIGAWEVFFIYVEHLGKSESAISQLLRSVFGLVGVAAWALASTCNSMVSNLIGQEKLNEVIPLIKKVATVSFLVALSLGILLLIFPEHFLRILTDDEMLIQGGIASLRIVVLATWMLSVSTIVFNGVVGIGDTKVNMYFELTAIVLYLIYCTTIIEKMKLPLPFAWGSEFVYWLSLFTMSSLYLYRWRKKQVGNLS